MAPGADLKQRIRDGETIQIVAARLGATAESLRALLGERPCDLLFIDAQHQPYDDVGLQRFCQVAASCDLPVAVRLMHPSCTWQIGHLLDLGALGIVVPLAETAATATAAVESFYYPPLGRRSWGPGGAWDWADHATGHDYADWWNSHGVLMLQIESREGVGNCRALARPGVDLLCFGANDLLLDLRRHPGAGMCSFEDCQRFVAESTRDLPVKVSAAPAPLGAV